MLLTISRSNLNLTVEKKEPHENSTKPQMERKDSARRFARFLKAILKVSTVVILSGLLGFGAVINAAAAPNGGVRAATLSP